MFDSSKLFEDTHVAGARDHAIAAVDLLIEAEFFPRQYYSSSAIMTKDGVNVRVRVSGFYSLGGVGVEREREVDYSEDVTKPLKAATRILKKNDEAKAVKLAKTANRRASRERVIAEIVRLGLEGKITTEEGWNENLVALNVTGTVDEFTIDVKTMTIRVDLLGVEKRVNMSELAKLVDFLRDF